MTTQKDYDNLHQISRHARLLHATSTLLDWDQETYMPPGGAAIRAEQQKTMAGIIHEERTGKRFRDALAKLIDIPKGTIKAKKLTDDQQAALKVWRRDYIKAKALPRSFVEELAQLSSQSILAWREAKRKNDFKHFAPFLEKLIALSRKKADFLGFQEHPYDALLDEYEPGTTTKQVSVLFTALSKAITALLKKISANKQIDDSFLHGQFSQDKQLDFSKRLLKDMGYSSEHGRLDFSSHPFSLAMHPTDSRITTRFHPTSLLSCISVMLHEAGHAFYEMGLPQEHYGSPLGEAISLGMHESQSRWWETRIGQSKAFWKYYLSLLKKQFAGQLNNISIEKFYRAINKVEPSLIRVEADEVTYPLHVILRFELEKALIEGSLKVKELPEAWKAKMKTLVGIIPKTNTEGCLQDIHWSMGAFGYFPTYTLGNLYAAQLFEAFAKTYPNWEARLATGDLLFIGDWLRQNVHRYGRRYSSHELLKKVSGKEFSANPYISYLENKYSEIYGW